METSQILTIIGGIIFIGILITILWSRRGKKATVKRGMIPTYMQSPQRYIDLEKWIVGRCVGENPTPNKDGETCDIIYTQGTILRKTKKREDVPKWAIQNIHPPDTPHSEGIKVVMPYSPLRTSYDKNIDFYKNYVYEVEIKMKRMRRIFRTLLDQINKKEDFNIAMEKYTQIGTLIEDTLRTTSARGKEFLEPSNIIRADEKEKKDRLFRPPTQL